MPDREKVIKGLYLCEWTSAGRYDGYEPDYESCFKCPYRGDDLEPDVCCADLMRDALELLKAQEPRVLTFDELMGLPHGKEDNVPVVSEVKYPVGAWDKGTICKWRGAEFLQEMVQDHHWYNRDHYGKIWRVWTALPSIEQRKAVKWE